MPHRIRARRRLDVFAHSKRRHKRVAVGMRGQAVRGCAPHLDTDSPAWRAMRCAISCAMTKESWSSERSASSSDSLTTTVPSGSENACDGSAAVATRNSQSNVCKKNPTRSRARGSHRPEW